MHPQLQPKKTKYYATIDADVDLVAAGGMNRPASEIMVGTAGILVVVNDDGSTESLDMPANVWVRGAFREITDAGTAAAKVFVVWYG